MELWDTAYKNKVIDPSELENAVRSIRSQGKTIATVNGSFDLMHAGHLTILYDASLQADVLIVGLNSDTSIQQYKSPDRPIIPLKYRLQMMTAIAFVDWVTWFDELDPRRLLNIIKPNVHINGPEYGENCIEADVVTSNGGKIHIAPFVEGLSTSSIIKKINQISQKDSSCVC